MLVIKKLFCSSLVLGAMVGAVLGTGVVLPGLVENTFSSGWHEGNLTFILIASVIGVLTGALSGLLCCAGAYIATEIAAARSENTGNINQPLIAGVGSSVGAVLPSLLFFIPAASADLLNESLLLLMLGVAALAAAFGIGAYAFAKLYHQENYAKAAVI